MIKEYKKNTIMKAIIKEIYWSKYLSYFPTLNRRHNQAGGNSLPDNHSGKHPPYYCTDVDTLACLTQNTHLSLKLI